MTITSSTAAMTATPDLGETFAKEAPALLGYFLNRITNHSDAADLVSETFLIAWRSDKRNTIPPEMTRAWLFGISRKVLAQYRRTGVRKTALAERLRTSIVTDATEEASPDDARDLRHLIRSLPELDREILMLVYWDGLTQEEAARILRRSASTVRSRLTRARQRLKQDIERQMSETTVIL